jgi:hypothetical protein
VKPQTQVNESFLGKTNDAFSTEEIDRITSVDVPKTRADVDDAAAAYSYLHFFAYLAFFGELGRILLLTNQA